MDAFIIIYLGGFAIGLFLFLASLIVGRGERSTGDGPHHISKILDEKHAHGQ